MRELLVATKNPGKFREIGEALLNVGDEGMVASESRFFELHFLKEFRVDDGDFVEDGLSFQENAEKKARYYYEKFKGVFFGNGVGPEDFFALGEDSGIMVDALDGELGVQTRRWGAGEQASDQEWIEYFLKRMEDVPEEKRGAKFVCHACVAGVDASGRFFVEHFFGETKGVITSGLEAPIKEGIPLSSCFRPEGFDRVYAALSTEEKNKISHRGKAMNGVWKFLAGMG
ncbi:hypothetical protein HZA40_02125 [Candidatus Peregrinibacteria bacterium]|nr:hypothetical protein [Candidatus Peregrinibacteria bacterium]